jgi:hypothetical protein
MYTQICILYKIVHTNLYKKQIHLNENSFTYNIWYIQCWLIHISVYKIVLIFDRQTKQKKLV